MDRPSSPRKSKKSPISEKPSPSQSMNEALIRVLDATPVAMSFSRIDGSFEYVNPAFNQMLGYEHDEIYGANLVISHPDDLELNETVRERLKKEPFEAVTVEKRYIHKSGRIVPGLLTIVAQPDAQGQVKNFIAQIIDLTKQKEEEESLWLLTKLLDHSQDAIYVTDPTTGNFIDCNRLAFERLGYSRNALLALNVRDISGTLPSKADWIELVEKAQKGSLFKESRHIRKDGSTFPVEASISYIAKGDTAYMLSIARDITIRKQNEAIIWEQANFDSLTNLANRRLLYKSLQKELNQANRNNTLVAVFYLDLDFFKEVNDSLGHRKGDLLLIETAQRLKKCLHDDHTLARQGGDEFAIILGDLHEKEGVTPIAESILSELRRPFQLEDQQVYISASIGISFFPDDGNTPDLLFKGADQAMYAAKNQGRNCFRYFTHSMHKLAMERASLIRDLRVARREGQFQLYYQPIVDLTTGELHKAEALLRWFHPTKGLIHPTTFIELAEETKLISDIGDWVFFQAAKQVAEWRESLHPDFRISINTSPLQYLDVNKTIQRWIPYLESLNLPGQALAVEITESVLMNTHNNITKQLSDFHAAGIAVALDDFGTGYSSLAYLKNFNVDYVKIDQLFVKELTADSNEMALCEAIIVMAHRLGIMVIAEGIETQEQRELLTSIGCDYGQGYWFSEPVSSDSFKKLSVSFSKTIL